MADEPKIEVDDLPKPEQPLAEQELDGVVGGVGHQSAFALKGKPATLRPRMSDPDSGEEFV